MIRVEKSVCLLPERYSHTLAAHLKLYADQLIFCWLVINKKLPLHLYQIHRKL